MSQHASKISAREIIELLDLKPHPEEGGFFSEVYRSPLQLPGSVLEGRVDESRSLATSIYYLLTPETFSTMHRLRFDEIFHFYLGDSVTMINLLPEGGSETIVLGSDLRRGERVQHIVCQDVWQGSFLNPGGEFALLGTTVSPGFDYRDYEAGDADLLCRQYPESATLIRRLVR